MAKPSQAIFCTILIFTILLISSKSSLSYFDPFWILEQNSFGLDNEIRDALHQLHQPHHPLPPARVDWKETPESHLIMLDVPGMNKDEMKIELDDENRIMKVIGERTGEEEIKSDQWHRVERCYGKFLSQFQFSTDVDLEPVGARLENGVLTVTLSKISPEKMKGLRVVSILVKNRHRSRPRPVRPRMRNCTFFFL